MKRFSFSINRIDLLIVLTSLAMMILVLNLPFKAKAFGDEFSFHAQSKALAAYLKGDGGYEKVTITKAPGPVFFYTLGYLFAPSNSTDNQLWVYAVVLTFIISTISLLFIYRIGLNLFSKEVGFLAVLLFFIFPLHAYYSLGVLAEIPAFFSLALALYGWSIIFNYPNKLKGWILLLLGLCFLILSRPNVMLILAIGFLIIGYSFFKRKEFFEIFGKKLALTFSLVAIVVFGVLQLAKAINETKTTENQEGLFYYVALQGRFQFREEPTDFRFWENEIRGDSKDYQNWRKSGEVIGQIMDKNHNTYNDAYREFLITDIVEHPFWFVRQFFVKAFYGHMYFINSVKPDKFQLGPIHGVIGYWFIILLINFVNIIIITGAFLFLFKEKNLINYWFFWSVILALLIFHGLTYMEPRYMFPARVALYIMSAQGLYEIKWVRDKVNFIAKFVFPYNKQTS